MNVRRSGGMYSRAAGLGLLCALLIGPGAAASVPQNGILHGFVTTQAEVPIPGLNATVIQVEGAFPFGGSQVVNATGEFIFNPLPGTYDVELRDDDEALIASVKGLNIYSNITTFTFVTVHTPDSNYDQVVDVADLLVVLAGWGPCPGGFEACPGDTDGDASVSVDDLLGVLAAWGSTA